MRDFLQAEMQSPYFVNSSNADHNSWYNAEASQPH